ncbi:MAG: AAA family ATPase [Acidimicrobiales bacterium]|nr:AAA family ATPase [Acidimicrobiales bacterium]
MELDLPNRVAPEDEYLILPADSSQNHAINRVLAGESLVVQGPPGTGKSQTIANLIAATIARGRRVLFVAEKRAAIDAVMERLASAGLAGAVLDLHSNASSRAQILKAYGDAMDAAGSIAAPDLVDLHQRLATSRSALVDHEATMHRPREPWGLSLFDLQVELVGARRHGDVPLRFPAATLRAIDRSVLTSAEQELREYVRLREIDGNPVPGPWSGAPLADATACAAAMEWATAALDRARELEREAAQSAAEMGISLPASRGGLDGFIGACSEAAELQQVLAYGAILDPELDAVAATLTESRGLAKMRGPYRAAKRHALNWQIEGQQVSFDGLVAAIVRAAALRSAWPGVVGPVPISVPGNLGALIAARQAFDAVVPAGAAAYLPPGAPADDLSQIVRQLEALAGDRDGLYRQPALRAHEASLDAAGLGEVRKHCVAQVLTPEVSAEVLRYVWHRSIYDLEAPADLGAFNGLLQNDRSNAYRTADREHLSKTPLRVRRAVAETLVAVRDAHPDQAQLLQAQTRRKRGLRPIRDLFREAPDVMLGLKPCWTMSPLLVAQMLPGDKQYFDLVIFDEASQVTPADAVSAILRAPQLVVAGDSRQLPPTAFFATDTSGDIEEESEEGGGIDLSLASGFESVLDVADSLMRASYLEWHYRSRDERLISFSNAHIYDSRLTTFPGAAADDCLEHVCCTGGSVDDEVDAVVERVLAHARTRPDESLGVITMGIKHAERVSEAVRLAVASAADRAALEPFFAESRDERFFVKNLERVQGDERDAIILSVGYGRGHDGRMVYRFGPLNNEGGERRLNVAVSRARNRMTVVSSFAAEDMDPKKTTAKGADLLRRFIRYAATQGEDLGFGGAAPVELNPFEIEVRDALEAREIPLVPQYGVSSYRLDFAAAHPDQPGRMVLAIECDGASYHSSPTARDRDRLRQEMLERLGWRFHRIWSTDWFRNPEACTDAAEHAWREAVRLADAAEDRADDAAGDDSSVEAEPELADDVPRRSGPKPVQGGGAPIDTYRPAQLDALVRWIASDTLLRTREEMVEEMVRALGYKRRGHRIIQAVEAAIDRVDGR